MPAPWAAGIRARIIGTIHGSQTVNVLHFGTNTVIHDDPDPNATLQALCQAIIECVATHVLPVVTSDWTFNRVECAAFHPTELDPAVVQAPLPNVGGGGPQGCTFAASLINLRTGRDGRKGRGKIFLPPAGEGNIANGNWDAAWLAALTAFALCLAGKFSGANPSTAYRLGVLSRKDFSATIGGGFDNAFREVNQYSPQAVAATMSSRKIGRGA